MNSSNNSNQEISGDGAAAGAVERGAGSQAAQVEQEAKNTKTSSWISKYVTSIYHWVIGSEVVVGKAEDGVDGVLEEEEDANSAMERVSKDIEAGTMVFDDPEVVRILSAGEELLKSQSNKIINCRAALEGHRQDRDETLGNLQKLMSQIQEGHKRFLEECRQDMEDYPMPKRAKLDNGGDAARTATATLKS